MEHSLKLILKPLQIRKSKICSLQSGNYIITLRLYDIMMKDCAKGTYNTLLMLGKDGAYIN